MNIDVDESGKFIAVWDRSVSGTVYVYANAGDVSSGSVSLGGDVLLLAGISPDVCLFGNNTDRVTYTYITNGSGGDVYIDLDEWSTINAGGSSNVNESTITTNTCTDCSFYAPRIGCPTNNNGTVDDWTVAVEDNDGTSKWHIVVKNENNGTISSAIVLNDGNGTNPPPFTNLELNYRPAVAYNNQTPYRILVGWTFDHSGGGYGASKNAVMPIAVLLDNYAAFTSQYYWEVPYYINNGDVAGCLSLSGRYAANTFFVAFFNDSHPDIFIKDGSASGLRVPDNSNLFESDVDILNTLNSVPEDANICVSLYSLTGQKIYFGSGNPGRIRKEFLQQQPDALSSACIMQLISSDGKINITKKIIR